jgi:hypothetical protein
VLNREFQVIAKGNINSRTVLCMVYNPVNDELLISAIDGIKVEFEVLIVFFVFNKIILPQRYGAYLKMIVKSGNIL